MGVHPLDPVGRAPAVRYHAARRARAKIIVRSALNASGDPAGPRLFHDPRAGSMAVQITIRDVPRRVRDELAARAASQGKSMQEYLRGELERLAARPTVEAWLEQVRKRKRASQRRISSRQILKERNADRR